MTTDLFTSENNPDIDPNKDYLTELVGDGKKFKTQQDLARGKYEADNFIEQLKKENENIRREYIALREESTARAKLADLVDQLRAAPPPAAPTSSNQPPANVDHKPSYNAQELETLVDSRLEQRELARQQSANFNSVQAKLKEQFGSNYQTVLKTQMEELRLPVDFVNDLARRSPEAFFRTMGLNEQKPVSNTAPPRGSIRSEGFKDKAGAVRDWDFYQSQQKANPNFYKDPKNIVQMEKDLAALGEEKFYGSSL